MRLFFYLFFCYFIVIVNVYALSESTFNETEKYQILSIHPIQEVPTFNLMTTFYPPFGKKLNEASYVKVWEKIKNEWIQIDELNPDHQLEFSGEYHLEKKIKAKNKNSELAIEVEFIHCNHSGGQCAMERYLGKITRLKNSKDQNINLTFRI